MAHRSEAQYQEGSRETVLKNILGITSARKMNRVERHALGRMARFSFQSCAPDRRFTARDICNFHRLWLGGVYSWAGEYRQVNVSKAGFLFAAAHRVPALMSEFEAGPLARYTPCTFRDRVTLLRALAETHAEIVLIHPFREGNGRIARHLSSLMAWQAGLPPLDFNAIAGEGMQEYFAAVRAALERRYGPMEEIFAKIIGSGADAE